MEDVPRATSSIGRSSLRSALVISLTGVIVASLAITLYHYIMIRYCIRRRAAMAAAAAASAAAGGTAQSRPFTGVDEKILETIPIYAFTAVKSGIDQDECAVCLGELEDGDSVRLLPTCNHAFHVTCIDRWFTAQTTCPLCRYPVVDEETDPDPDLDGVSDSDVPSIEESDLESETVNSPPIAIENTGNNRESSSSAAAVVEQPLQLLIRHPWLSVDRRLPAPAPRLLERSMSLDPKLICTDGSAEESIVSVLENHNSEAERFI